MIETHSSNAELDSFMKLDADKLVAVIIERLSAVQKSIMALAIPVEAACSRGIELPAKTRIKLPDHYITTLRRVARGQTSEALATLLFGFRRMRHVELLPIETQESLACGQPVPVVRYDPKHGTSTQMLSVLEMSDLEAKTIFSGGTVMPESQQKAKVRLATEQNHDESEFDDADTFYSLKIPTTPRRIAAMKKAAAKAGKLPQEYIAGKLKGIL